MRAPKLCGHCGSEKFRKLKASDTLSLPWKDYPVVTLTTFPEGFKCSQCGELDLNAAQAGELDRHIMASIVGQVQSFIAFIMQREKCEQRQIAMHLGVSPEYLSEIKSGRKLPKFQTYNFLKTLAMDPESFKVSSPTYRSGKRAV